MYACMIRGKKEVQLFPPAALETPKRCSCMCRLTITLSVAHQIQPEGLKKPSLPMIADRLTEIDVICEPNVDRVCPVLLTGCSAPLAA